MASRKLQEYLDTGLTPEECAELAARAGRLQIDFDHACHALKYAEGNARNREMWQRRAEALESCLYGKCEVCVHENESIQDTDSICNSAFLVCDHWQFDEVRFAGGNGE